MGKYRQILGSANFLLAFEAAARLGSFTNAAQELNVTQPAVTRQIRCLEENLGYALFERRGVRAKLTYEGQKLFEVVSAAVASITECANELATKRAGRQFSIESDAIMATHWLLPLFSEMCNAEPNLELRLKPLVDGHSNPSGTSDIAICFGTGAWPGYRTTKLLSEVMFPVCSPAFAAEHGLPAPLERLIELPLLELISFQSAWMSWRNWCALFGIDSHQIGNVHSFDSYEVLMEAAVQGRGIALGWKYLVAQDMRTERLLPAADVGIFSEFGEFLVVRWDRYKDPTVAKLCTLLEESAAKSVAEFSSLGPRTEQLIEAVDVRRFKNS